MSNLFPSELWLQILEIACAIPGELNANASSLFERPSHLDCLNARRAALSTRRALPRVSRLFNQLSTPLLFQSISLRHGRTLNALLRTFKKTEALDEDGKPSPGYGLWVKRLDIDFRRKRLWNYFQPEDLYTIFSYTPNLMVFVGLGTWPSLDGDLLVASLNSCLQLRNLSLPSDVLPGIYDHMFQIVTHISTLRTYFPTPTPHDIPNGFDPDSHGFQNLGQCKNLIAATSSDVWLLGNAERDARYFPHLHTLHWYNGVNVEFIQTHGFKIKTIDLESNSWTDIVPYLQHFPNLERVIVDAQQIAIPYLSMTGSRQSYIHPVPCRTVKIVGVTAYSSQPSHKRYTALFEFLPDCFPGLQRILILEDVGVKNLSSQLSRIVRWHNYLAQRNIRLEREDGDLLIRCNEQTAVIRSE
ncbi:hypothetical protein FRB91_009230 [Serendipita sp. 411]|nr:hypothetical protein FRB91_009230 [Serendipita sp. 411]